MTFIPKLIGEKKNSLEEGRTTRGSNCLLYIQWMIYLLVILLMLVICWAGLMYMGFKPTYGNLRYDEMNVEPKQKKSEFLKMLLPEDDPSQSTPKDPMASPEILVIYPEEDVEENRQPIMTTQDETDKDSYDDSIDITERSYPSHSHQDKEASTEGNSRVPDFKRLPILRFGRSAHYSSSTNLADEDTNEDVDSRYTIEEYDLTRNCRFVNCGIFNMRLLSLALRESLENAQKHSTPSKDHPMKFKDPVSHTQEPKHSIKSTPKIDNNNQHHTITMSFKINSKSDSSESVYAPPKPSADVDDDLEY